MPGKVQKVETVVGGVAESQSQWWSQGRLGSLERCKGDSRGKEQKTGRDRTKKINSKVEREAYAARGLVLLSTGRSKARRLTNVSGRLGPYGGRAVPWQRLAGAAPSLEMYPAAVLSALGAGQIEATTGGLLVADDPLEYRRRREMQRLFSSLNRTLLAIHECSAVWTGRWVETGRALHQVFRKMHVPT